MPRRPSKGHKKKANGPRPVDRKAGTIRKWNTADDVELDEEDQCAFIILFLCFFLLICLS